ncbi:MAG: OmpA family protein [Pseudomonadota bacterium]|nr:OmpA family protein [Pseudomonadota bacterium]
MKSNRGGIDWWVRGAQVGRTVALALRVLAAPALAQDAPAPDASTVTLDGNKLVLPGPITFQTASATLSPESDAAIAAAAAWLQAKSFISTARVEGHGDADGDASQALSEARAMAVAKALVAKGVDCKRLLAVGFGGNKPVADNGTAEGKAQNRRVEIHNAAMRDRPIGGMPLDGGGRVAGNVCGG